MDTELLKKLIQILKKEYREYQKLLELAEEKKDALVANDIDVLSSLLNNEEEILETINQFDAAREDIIIELSTELDLVSSEINYSQLIEHLPDKWVNKLKPVREKLLTTINELHELNESNKMLINEAIKLNNLTYKSIAQIIEPNNNTYNRETTGKSDNSTTHIMDRKA